MNEIKYTSKSGMTFESFVEIIKQGLASGVLTMSNEMSELDYAVYWSICMLREEAVEKEETIEKHELFFTFEDIFHGVRKYCGEDVFRRVFGKEANNVHD